MVYYVMSWCVWYGVVRSGTRHGVYGMVYTGWCVVLRGMRYGMCCDVWYVMVMVCGIVYGMAWG